MDVLGRLRHSALLHRMTKQGLDEWNHSFVPLGTSIIRFKILPQKKKLLLSLRGGGGSGILILTHLTTLSRKAVLGYSGVLPLPYNICYGMITMTGGSAPYDFDPSHGQKASSFGAIFDGVALCWSIKGTIRFRVKIGIARANISLFASASLMVKLFCANERSGNTPSIMPPSPPPQKNQKNRKWFLNNLAKKYRTVSARWKARNAP